LVVAGGMIEGEVIDPLFYLFACHGITSTP
jgi:hypothetical protein